MIPATTVLLPEIPNILTGSIFIESVFRIPGIGRFFVTSTTSRDYPMILALVLLVAAVWGLTYLITDILYTILDPRIRIGGGSMTRVMAMATTDATTLSASVEPTLGVRRKSRTNFQLAKQRFFRQKLAVVGLVLVVLFLICALFAPLLAPTGYADANLMDANKFPSREYPFGTDTIGHDMVSRVIYGIRTSMVVAFSAVALACLIGVPLGLAAGLQAAAGSTSSCSGSSRS